MLYVPCSDLITVPSDCSQVFTSGSLLFALPLLCPLAQQGVLGYSTNQLPLGSARPCLPFSFFTVFVCVLSPKGVVLGLQIKPALELALVSLFF